MRLYINILVLAFFFALLTNAQDPLPKFLTDDEKETLDDYKKSVKFDIEPVSHPEQTPRMPAEFEEAGGLIISWAGFYDELIDVVFHTSGRGADVYILTKDPTGVQNDLISANIRLEGVHLLEIPFNSVWVRDYGPQSIYLAENDQLAFVDWQYNLPRPYDNSVPYHLANYLNLPLHKMKYDQNKLFFAGGNIMVDGHGTAFSSKLVLADNAIIEESKIRKMMYNYLGIDNYVILDMLPNDEVSHIDMYIKLLDEETLLVGEFPPGVSDRYAIEQNLNYLSENAKTAYGRPFNIVHIPMVPDPTGKYPPDAEYRSYTNSLILNKTVLVPQFHDRTLNAKALDIYRRAMPGYNIVGINSENLVYAWGAIHCITKEVAANNPVFIIHAPIREANPGESIKIEAEIKSVVGLNGVALYWRDSSKSYYQQTEMVLDGGIYKAYIPEQSTGTKIFYYIRATNNNNKIISKPFSAPGGFYEFVVGTATSVPEQDEEYVLKVFPNPSNGSFNIAVPETHYTIDVSISNMQGSIIYKNEINNTLSGSSYYVDLGNISPGVYIVRIVWGQNSKYTRIIVT